MTIDSKKLHLLGENPATTTIRGFQNVIQVKGTFLPNDLVEVEGFTIQGGNNVGVWINSGTAQGSVHNCIIVSNRNGIAVAASGYARAYNNVIISSSDVGARADGEGSELTIIGNILINNAVGAYACRALLSSSYNNYFGNGTHQSGCLGSGPTSFNDTFDEDPLFADLNTGDFHLKAGSPCIDAGSPSRVDNDPDGTGNDQGVYGGPDAAPFWPRPGRAVVLQLSVTPHDVALGGTLRIQATGKAQ